MSKVAIVTGAAKGLGKAFSESLLKRGVQVCLSDVDVTRGEQTIQELQGKYGSSQAMFMKCDTTSQADMEEMFGRTKDQFSGIDLVVNNAGIVHEKHWEKMIEINLMGVIRGTLLGIEHMRKDQGGRGGQIINISSSAGLYPVPFAPGYCAGKFGVIGYTTSWAEHPLRKKYGISYNCLCPFFANTDIINIKEEQVYSLDLAKLVLKLTGVMSVDKVLAAFEDLLEEEKNGAVIKISATGHKEVEYPKLTLDIPVSKP